MAVLNSLVLMAVLGVASVKSDCVAITCGSTDGIRNAGPVRQLDTGDLTMEKVKMCQDPSGHYLMGFEATVCEDQLYSKPSAACTGLKSDVLLVHKNGGNSGTIQFVAYCEFVPNHPPSVSGKTQDRSSRMHHYSHHYNDERIGHHHHNNNRYHVQSNRHY